MSPEMKQIYRIFLDTIYTYAIDCDCPACELVRTYMEL